MTESPLSKVMNLLRCPRCHAGLYLDSAGASLKCKDSIEHRFPIKDGIPSLVSPEEIPPKDTKWVFEYDERTTLDKVRSSMRLSMIDNPAV